MAYVFRKVQTNILFGKGIGRRVAVCSVTTRLEGSEGVVTINTSTGGLGLHRRLQRSTASIPSHSH